MARTQITLLVLGVASLLIAKGLLACEEIPLTSPARSSTVAESRPTLSWPPLTGADRYRVQLESRVPEGRVLLSLDTLVSGTTFRPPRALTDFRAAVKVRVTHGCSADDITALREKPAWFQIDTSPLCPAPARIAVTGDRRTLEWAPVPGALKYDVSLRSTEGDAKGQGETKIPHYTLPADRAALVAVVRPYCATGFGPRVSLLVAP